MGFIQVLQALVPLMAKADHLGLIAIGAGLAVCTGTFSSIGEAIICSHAIDGMVRNPDQAKNLRSTMILAVALDESTAIYSFVVAILILFALN